MQLSWMFPRQQLSQRYVTPQSYQAHVWLGLLVSEVQADRCVYLTCLADCACVCILHLQLGTTLCSVVYNVMRRSNSCCDKYVSLAHAV